METRRVAIFASVSTPQQAQGKDSLPSQVRDGRAWAEERGWPVVAVYEVPGHTRKYIFYDEAKREIGAYARLRADCEAQVFDVLWCRARDRLGRTDALISQAEALVRDVAGAEIYSAAMPAPVGGGAESAIMLSALERGMAEAESVRRVKRITVGIEARVREGLPASHWPHGYRPVKDATGATIGGEFVPGEIGAVRLATGLFLAGHGYYTLVKMLNESDYRPRHSDVWRYSTVHGMMKNEFYAGYVTYGDARNAEPSAHFPALWDAETYRRILREHQRRHRGGSPPASPASGIVYCRRCGSRMTSLLSREGVRRFRCSTHAERGALGHEGCHYNPVDEDDVIAVLEESLRYFAQDPAIMEAALEEALPDRAVLKADVDQARARVREVKAQQDRLAAAVAAGALAVDAARRHNDGLAADLDAATTSLRDAEGQLAAMPSQDAQRQHMAALIADPRLRSVPIPEARAMLQRAGARVYVEEGEIVKVVWGGPCA
jgi:site-specific DNA recombinase